MRRLVFFAATLCALAAFGLAGAAAATAPVQVTDDQFAGDIGVREPACDELENLELLQDRA